MTGRHGDDWGIAHVEVAIASVVLFVLSGLVVFAGRTANLDTEVQVAAAAAARAAAREATPSGATAAAQATAAANLADASIACADLDVVVAAGTMAPGSTVSVSITCTADFADLVVLAMPGQRSYHATAADVVDTYRGHG